MIKRIYITAFVIGSLMSIGACKKALDINTDPNNPTHASIDLILPAAQGYTAYNLGNAYQILGGLWGQYWTQGPTASQYKTLDQYSISSNTYDRQWQSLYAGPLIDFKYIADEGTRLGRKNYAAIGKIMMAFIFQYLTDLHGDIPFSEALDPAKATPNFDAQEVIYNGLVQLVTEGLALIDLNSGDHPGSDDLVFGGDMGLWKKFGNSLKLRIYLRQAYVRPAVADAGIKAMYTSGATFPGAGEDGEVHFTTAVFNQNPLFATYQALTEANIIASNTALNYLRSTNDPRMAVFYIPATAAPNVGNFVGIDQGNGALLPGQQDDHRYSKPGALVGGPVGGEDAPVVFISAAESYFLQAEAAVRGWGNGDAKALYELGVKASFIHSGLTQDQASLYLLQSSVAYPAGGSVEDRIKAVIFQKWVSMCGSQNLEAWTEWRRTGYPNIFTVSTTSEIGSRFPQRILIADSEVSRNPKTPAQKAITDKVWWDVNTTGQN